MSPDLVLLHPFPLDGSFWDAVRHELPPQVNVAAPNMPGFGTSGLRPGWTIDDATDLVAEGIARPAVVCGLSMGGYVALALALRHPRKVASLVLANTRAEADDAQARERRDAAVARIRQGGLSGYLDELAPRLVHAGAPPGLVERVREIAGRQPGDAIAEALRALRDRPDRTADLSRIGVPTLVVWGDADSITPEAAARALASGIPGARLEVIAKAGHLSAIERPADFAALLREERATLSRAP